MSLYISSPFFLFLCGGSSPGETLLSLVTIASHASCLSTCRQVVDLSLASPRVCCGWHPVYSSRFLIWELSPPRGGVSFLRWATRSFDEGVGVRRVASVALRDQSAGHALARIKRLLSGGRRNGPAAAITHQAVTAYTSLTTPGASAFPCWTPWWVGDGELMNFLIFS